MPPKRTRKVEETKTKGTKKAKTEKPDERKVPMLLAQKLKKWIKDNPSYSDEDSDPTWVDINTLLDIVEEWDKNTKLEGDFDAVCTAIHDVWFANGYQETFVDHIGDYYDCTHESCRKAGPPSDMYKLLSGMVRPTDT